jgi:serine/threonine-protein kinase RsbW
MAERSQTITLNNDLTEIARLAEFVDLFCAPLGSCDKDRLSLQLALEEAVTNIIKHGYGDVQPHTFTVELSCTDRRVIAIVVDDAPAFDPLTRPEVDTSVPLEQRTIGGLGVHLLKKLMDSARYERRDGRNILTLVRELRPAT